MISSTRDIIVRVYPHAWRRQHRRGETDEKGGSGRRWRKKKKKKGEKNTLEKFSSLVKRQ